MVVSQQSNMVSPSVQRYAEITVPKKKKKKKIHKNKSIAGTGKM